MLDHLTHLYLEILTAVGYVFIAAMFLIAFFFHKGSKKGRNACLMLVFIFVFCGITRIMYLVGFSSIFHDIAMLILPFATWGFIGLNRPYYIVNSLQDMEVTVNEKEQRNNNKDVRSKRLHDRPAKFSRD